MASVNKVILIGRLGQDPKIVTTQSGKFASFNLATSESWKDKQTGERKERTEWHSVVLNTTVLAEFAERYARKGSLAYVEGSLRTRNWQDQNGSQRYTTEIVAGAFNGQFLLLESKTNSSQENSAPGTSANVGWRDDDMGYDDIPF